MTIALVVVLCAISLVFGCYSAYQKGKRDVWDKICKEYICFHKSVIIIGNRKEKIKKTIDNRRKKIYNKVSYSSKK